MTITKKIRTTEYFNQIHNNRYSVKSKNFFNSIFNSNFSIFNFYGGKIFQNFTFYGVSIVMYFKKIAICTFYM